MDDLEVLKKSCARRGHVVGDKYVLEDVLGIGGMGVVHAAVQRSLDRTVAVKLPRPEFANDVQVRRLFRNEALTGSRINHRNIVGMVDYGDEGGVPYLVMEHIVGPRLGELLDEVGRLPYVAAVDIVRQIVGGLEDAHANRIVHADVKCDNVLIQTMRDGTFVPRLIDFGIARFLDETFAIDRDDPVVTGTPEYIAPEVVEGAPPTLVADVYAIGVMLYELITGTTPFGGGAATAIMSRKLEVEATPINRRCPELGIPVELDELVCRMLARNPKARPADARSLARCLDSIPKHPATLTVDRPHAIFSEAVTATMAPERRGRSAPVGLERPSVAEHRLRVIAAIKHGSVERIAAAYHELARALIEDRHYTAAQAELEEAVELLMTPSGRGPVWRLMLSLAALYERNGDHARARLAASAARDQAIEVGSVIGRERSERLCVRLRRARPVSRT